MREQGKQIFGVGAARATANASTPAARSPRRPRENQRIHQPWPRVPAQRVSLSTPSRDAVG